MRNVLSSCWLGEFKRNSFAGALSHLSELEGKSLLIAEDITHLGLKDLC